MQKIIFTAAYLLVGYHQKNTFEASRIGDRFPHYLLILLKKMSRKKIIKRMMNLKTKEIYNGMQKDRA